MFELTGGVHRVEGGSGRGHYGQEVINHIRPIGANFIELLSTEFFLANIFAKHYKTDYQPSTLILCARLVGNQKHLLSKYFWF